MAYNKTATSETAVAANSISTSRKALIRKGLQGLSKNDLIEHLVAGSATTTTVVRNLFGGNVVPELEQQIINEKARHKRATLKISELVAENNELRKQVSELVDHLNGARLNLNKADSAIAAKNNIINSERRAASLKTKRQTAFTDTPSSAPATPLSIENFPLHAITSALSEVVKLLNPALITNFPPHVSDEAVDEVAKLLDPAINEVLTVLLNRLGIAGDNSNDEAPAASAVDRIEAEDGTFYLVGGKPNSTSVLTPVAVKHIIDNLTEAFGIGEVELVSVIDVQSAQAEFASQHAANNLDIDALAILFVEHTSGGGITVDAEGNPILLAVIWKNREAFDCFANHAKELGFTGAASIIVQYLVTRDFGKVYTA